jgi:cation:H+ antiporter
LILLASVTSLPELVSSISAVVVVGAPDIAVGNMLGSCLVNLAMLAVVDWRCRDDSLYRRASRSHLLSAGFGVILLCLAGIGILLGTAFPALALALGHVSYFSPVLVLLYAVAVRTVLLQEREQVRSFAEGVASRYPAITLPKALCGYALAGSVVTLAGVWLPVAGEALAQHMGWSGSFIGTLLMASATTLPELAVTLSAVRMGAVDMAVGNLLGSNLFNMAILALDDMLYRPGPIFAGVPALLAVSALAGSLMTGMTIVGLVCRSRQHVFGRLSWVSAGLIAVFLLNALLLFHGG